MYGVESPSVSLVKIKDLSIIWEANAIGWSICLIFLACVYLPASYMQSSGKLPVQQLLEELHLWDELLMSLQVSEVCNISSTCSFITPAEQFHFVSSFIACTSNLKYAYLILAASSTPSKGLQYLWLLKLQPIKMNSATEKRESLNNQTDSSCGSRTNGKDERKLW